MTRNKQAKDKHIHSHKEKNDIAKAKFILAQKFGIESQVAYERMRNYSTKFGLRVCDIARRVIRGEQPIVNALGNRS